MNIIILNHLLILELPYMAYKCKLIAGNLTLTEHTDYKWSSKEEMQELDFAEADKPFINLI